MDLLAGLGLLLIGTTISILLFALLFYIETPSKKTKLKEHWWLYEEHDRYEED